MSEADLILFVLNYNESLTESDYQLFEAIKNEDFIVIINKTDLEQHLDMDELKEMIGDYPIVQTSMVEQQGIEELEQKISELFFGGQVQSQDMTYVSNSRHIALLKDAKSSINDAIHSAEEGIPIDIVQIDLIKTWELLGEVIGEEASESLIDQLFSQFCLGK